MAKDAIDISLDRPLWNGLSKFAHEQSIAGNRRFPTIHALRLAIKAFLRMTPGEINEVLKRTNP